jgi:hypothetical protein
MAEKPVSRWVFENRALRRIFGPKREEITDCPKILNGDSCSTYGEEVKYRETCGKTPGHRWGKYHVLQWIL